MKAQNIQMLTWIIATSLLLLAGCQKESLVDTDPGKLEYEMDATASIDNALRVDPEYTDREVAATQFLITSKLQAEVFMQYDPPVEPREEVGEEEPHLTFDNGYAGFTLSGEGIANTRFIGICGVGVDITYDASKNAISGRVMVSSSEDESSVTFEIDDWSDLQKFDESVGLECRLETVATSNKYEAITRWGSMTLTGLEALFKEDVRTVTLDLTVKGYYRL